MASRLLTCIFGGKAETPYGVIRLPQGIVGDGRIPVRFKDEVGTTLGLGLAQPDANLAGDAFLVSARTANALGLEEGFDYVVEPIGHMPGIPKTIALGFNGEKTLSVALVHKIESFRKVSAALDNRILEPGSPALIHGNNLLGVLDEVSPPKTDPPWLITPQTQIIVTDLRGPQDVIIAIDGPVSMKKTDLREKPGAPPRPRMEVLCELAASFGVGMSSNRNPGRVAFFILEEKATPIMFSETDQMTPWLSCSGRNPEELAPLVNLTLSARLASNFTSCRNLAGGLQGMFQFIRGRNPSVRKPVTSVILISDGQYTEGPNPVSIMKEEVKREIAEVLHVICIGEEGEELILKRCAQLGRGTYQRASDAGQLSAGLGRLAKRFEVVLND